MHGFKFFRGGFLEHKGVSLRWPEEVWRSLVESAPDALVMVDSSGTIVFVNSQTSRLFGYAPQELLNQKIEILLPQRYQSTHVGQRAGYFSDPHVRPMGARRELFGLHKDGHEVPVEISLSPLSLESGLLVTAAIRDISDRKKVQEELKNAREKAEEASRAKSEFLANMSHEIRTPLAGILGYSEMIALYCSSDEERQGYLEKIRRCADTLSELINDILDLSKVEAGALRVESLRFDIVKEIENTASLFQLSADEKKLAYEVRYERPLPIEMSSDPTRLRQIISNLLGNAIKFTDRGRIVLKVYCDKAAPGWIHFTVSDTGCGLTPEQQGKLFQAFVQADNSTTRKYGGTRLGLALSRKLAEALGGTLDLQESRPDEGSTFKLSLPIQVAGSRELDSQNLKAVPSDLSSRFVLGQVKVLLAEDNPDNQEIIRKVLESHGALVDIADNGRQALDMGLKEAHDVILADIQMPEMDGIEMIRQLRQKRVTTPIVAMTAHAMREEKAKCFEAGCDEFLSKPLDITRLISTISSLCKL